MGANGWSQTRETATQNGKGLERRRLYLSSLEIMDKVTESLGIINTRQLVHQLTKAEVLMGGLTGRLHSWVEG